MNKGNSFKGITMTDVAVGISVPKGSDIEFHVEDVNMTRGRTFFEEREEPGLVEKLGLPPDTDHQLLVGLIEQLITIPVADEQTRLETIKSTKIWSFIEKSANASSIIQGLLAVSAIALGAPSAS